MTDHDIRKEDQKDLVEHFTGIIDDLRDEIEEMKEYIRKQCKPDMEDIK